MTTLVNDAFSRIAHAPLRYYRPGTPQPSVAPPGVPGRIPAYDTSAYGTALPANADRIEYWVRFVCGCLAGAFLALDVVSLFLDSEVFTSGWKQMALLFSGVTLAFGLLAARYGDKFWHAIFRRWWLWP
jgi:hypothetical protein